MPQICDIRIIRRLVFLCCKTEFFTAFGLSCPIWTCLGDYSFLLLIMYWPIWYKLPLVGSGKRVTFILFFRKFTILKKNALFYYLHRKTSSPSYDTT